MRGTDTLVDPERYLVFEAEVDMDADDRLCVFEESSGTMTYGRRATSEERRQYQRQHEAGQDTDTIGGHRFLIGYRDHLSRCTRWDGKPFRGWVKPGKKPAKIMADPVPNDERYEEQQILLGMSCLVIHG
jgi:hypothetical protein